MSHLLIQTMSAILEKEDQETSKDYLLLHHLWSLSPLSFSTPMEVKDGVKT